MKLKALALALFLAGFAASFALADDGKPEPSKTTTGTTTTRTGDEEHHGDKGKGDCRRLELAGTLVSVSGSSVTLNVTRANDAGSALVGTPATLTLSPKTRLSWEGVGSFAAPAAGDAVRVRAAQCTAPATTTTTGTTPTATSSLVAATVDVRAAGSFGEKHK
jgi:hypothetical protein